MIETQIAKNEDVEILKAPKRLLRLAYKLTTATQAAIKRTQQNALRSIQAATTIPSGVFESYLMARKAETKTLADYFEAVATGESSFDPIVEEDYGKSLQEFANSFF